MWDGSWFGRLVVDTCWWYMRYLSYLMAGLVGTIGFLMSSKPVLW